MYIPRSASTLLRKLLLNRKIVLILGPRQIGKTTLVEPIVREQGGLLLNCDIRPDRARLLAAASLTPSEAISLLGAPKILAINEAQNVPEVGRIAKGWHDTEVPTTIILLGSSNLDLLDRAAEPLTGRNEEIYLPPVTFEEILSTESWFSKSLTAEQVHEHFADQIHTLLMRQMVFGSYPEAITTHDKEHYLLNLTSDYLLRDVLENGLVRSPRAIRDLLTMLAHQTGSEVSINELSNQLNLARNTIESYLALLERTYVIFRLRAFSANQRKEISKSSKIYFWDTGIRNALLKEFSLSPQRSDIGALFENWIVAEMAKRNVLDGDRNSLYFWRRTDGSEVDLIIKGTNRFDAYEIKWSSTNRKRGSHGFTRLYDTPIQVITKNNILVPFAK